MGKYGRHLRRVVTKSRLVDACETYVGWLDDKELDEIADALQEGKTIRIKVKAKEVNIDGKDNKGSGFRRCTFDSGSWKVCE